jgi:Concanavalin A-like lectin/glucanases superfamily/Bacterial pre-peptidase C-terminal domain
MKPLVKAALALCLLPASMAFCQPPSINRMLPSGVPPGKAVDVVFQGAALAGPTGVWSTIPLTAELTPGIEGNGTAAGSVSYRLTIPPETPPGVAAVRVATGQGISNVRLFVVDDLPSTVKAGGNSSIATAQSVSMPMAVDGACDPEASDFYKISAAAGQRVSVEVFARRLGSPLDPVIRLLSADGQELAFSDDEPATGVDGHFVHTFAAAGDYFVEIRDIRYQGGGNHQYHLRIGDFPLVSVPYPLAVQKGTSAGVQLAGPSVELAGPVAVTVPPDVPGGRLGVAASYGAGQGSAWTTLVASDVAEQLEQEPNDTPETSTPVTTGGAMDGRFESAGDTDYYQFEAKKDQRLVFAGQTRGLGSPCDLFMRLYKADGGAVAEAEDTGSSEGKLNYTFPADGVYRLRVEETNRRGGGGFVYRIVVAPYQAGFELDAAAEKVDAPQNGVFVVKVTAARRDYNGPITLSVEGAGEGAQVRNNVIPEGKPETTMNVTLGSNLSPGQIGTVRIIGQAKIGETDFRATASTLAALRGSLSGLPYPPAALDGTLGLGVGPVFPQFFQLASAAPSVPLVKSGAQAAVKVALTRSNGFEEKVTLAVEGLPAGVTAKAAAIEKGQKEASLELTSTQPIPPGKYPLKIVGSATFQNQPQTFVFDKVAIDGPPIGIAFAPSGPLPPGGKQKGTLTFAGDVQPVAPTATYQSGVTRGAEGPRSPALAGFEADNRAAAFSGVDKGPGDDRLTAQLPTAATGDYTIEMWLYNTRDLGQPNSPAISGYVFSRAGTPGPANAQPGDHLGIGGVESSPRDKLFFYDGTSLVPGRTTLSLNAWHHVVLVRAGDDVKVYLDGEVANPEIQAKAPKSFGTREIVLGTRADGFAPFQGRLDEVAFFDAPLSPEQVQAHFAAAKATTPARDAILKDNPLAYWRLDETEGQTAASAAPAHKRLVRLAWQNLPASISAPAEVMLVDAQKTVEIELAAAESVPAGKLEKVVVTGTTPVGGSDFTAEAPPVAIEVNKP